MWLAVVSQPFDQHAHIPELRTIDKESGEFWVPNPWMFPVLRENLSAYERNGVYLNTPDGNFLDMSFLTGADSQGDGRTSVGWDITGDGMPELFVRQAGGGPLLIYRNLFPRTNWLTVSLRGRQSNSFGIGARLTCEVDGRRICRELYPVINFLSQRPAAVHLGLQDATRIERLTIRWPSGRVQVLENLDVNRHIRVTEGEDTIETVGEPDRSGE